MIFRSSFENRNDAPVFISYVISGGLLAKVLAANNITGAELFCSANGVRTVVDAADIVISYENGGNISVPQALARAWIQGEGLSGLIQYKELSEENLCGDTSKKADCLSYKLETVFDGSEVAKLNVIHELFTKTDLGSRLGCRRVSVYKGSGETMLGGFPSGGERLVTENGRLTGYSADACGGTVIEYDDGVLKMWDCGDADWSDRTLQSVLSFLGDREKAVGVDTVEKISCERLFLAEFPVQVRKISAGALTDCPKLRTVKIDRRDAELGEGFADRSVILKGVRGCSAERYANDHGMQFDNDIFAPAGEKTVELYGGITVAVPEESQFTGSMIYDIGYSKKELCGYLDAETEHFDNRAEFEEARKKLSSVGNVSADTQLEADEGLSVRATMRVSTHNQLNRDFDVYMFVLEICSDKTFLLISSAGRFKKHDAASVDAAFERIKQLGRSAELAAEPQTMPAAAEEPEPMTAAAPETETAAEPVIEQPVTEELASEQPVIEEPVIEEPVIAEVPAGEQPVIEQPPAEQPAPVQQAGTVKKLVMGERFSLEGYENSILAAELTYEAPEGVDIDGYAFLLGADGKVGSDADLIFFGQTVSKDGSVSTSQDNTRGFSFALSKTDSNVEKIALCFAVYGEDESRDLSQVKKAVLRFSCEGNGVCEFELSGLSNERSVVAAELYKKGSWKIRTVSRGFKGALKSLCESYGVEVE
ncbi:MAG: TerD family protein [Ruminococcus sp.]|nr:TerD family protein [Ruminococcus sp.]